MANRPNYAQLAANMDFEATTLIATQGRTNESSDVRLLRDGAKAIRQLAPAPEGAQEALYGWVLLGADGSMFVSADHPHIVDATLKFDGCTAVAVYTAPTSQDGEGRAWRAFVDSFVGSAALGELRRRFDAASPAKVGG